MDLGLNELEAAAVRAFDGVTRVDRKTLLELIRRARALPHAVDQDRRSHWRRVRMSEGATLREIRLMHHMLGASHPNSPLGWRNYGAFDEADTRLRLIIVAGSLGA